MKKVLFLPLVLIACLCPAQDAKKIIGKPIKIGNLLVAQNDFPVEMKWNDAKNACLALGKGWRLPTISECSILYKNRDSIGGFKYYYWSSAERSKAYARTQYFGPGYQSGYQGVSDKDAMCWVGAVK